MNSESSSIKTRIKTLFHKLLSPFPFASESSSIKTRIKTLLYSTREHRHGSSESDSIKTRIKTLQRTFLNIFETSLNLIPLKQGLRQSLGFTLLSNIIALNLIPLKQGLRPQNYILRFLFLLDSESYSIKTRIKTRMNFSVASFMITLNLIPLKQGCIPFIPHCRLKRRYFL